MKRFCTILLRATGIHFMLVTYHRLRLRTALSLMKRHRSDTEMPVWCSARFQRHQHALRHLGFLVEREFALAHRMIVGVEPYSIFRELLRARFPDGCWSCAAQGRRVIVIAPGSQISEWERFVSEYDRQAA
jgi:hypothetical protein